MRVCLFTDTLADVNGVSRFIQNVAHQAAAAGCDLTVVTSTRLPLPDAPNVVNLRPVFAGRMPRYEQLEFALPPRRRGLHLASSLRPDAIHVSTPGPVGVLGRKAARRLGVPILGTYHTDFPAYIDHLFDDACLTWATRATMRWFYRPFSGVFTRSRDYADSIAGLGVARERIVTLLPGIDTALFRRDHRDESIWSRVGVPAGAIKVLSVGRVSVEKNLPLLARAWPAARAACTRDGLDARLVVVGDGPYRPALQHALDGAGAHFLGFRHGVELAALYASADLFVFPSATDTLGQVAMEAQSCGLPVLVSDRGGPQEMVTPATGRVLPASDHGAWSRAIADLCRDAPARRRMGDAASAAMQAYSIRASFDHFWSVHEHAARKGGAGRGVSAAPLSSRSPAPQPSTP